MYLNDNSTDQERQRLLPYVTRLACADTPEIENERAAYIWKRVRNYHYFGVPFDRGLKVLEGALAIGRQADPLGPEEVRTRMEAVKAKARTPASVSDKPFFSKVKSWLTMKETEPAP
jgi:negative regulator of sigma E activity